MIRALAVAVALLPALALAEVAVPDGYRMDHYRAPVPSELPGGTVVGPEEAHARALAGAERALEGLPGGVGEHLRSMGATGGGAHGRVGCRRVGAPTPA